MAGASSVSVAVAAKTFVRSQASTIQQQQQQQQHSATTAIGMPSPTKASSGALGGSVKQKKVERKAKEQLMHTLQALSDKIGKLEDRDTQQQAFQALV